MAISALRDFMDRNLAASKIELEAKLIEADFGNPPFEPAHLHDARKRLILAGEMVIDITTTRGGGRPPIIVTTDRERRGRKVDDAMARKRLLMSRYYSYVQGGEDAGASLSGPAGEAAFQAALLRASVGASLAKVNRGVPSVPQVLGRDVPIGPLDNAFILQPLDRISQEPVGPWGTHVLVEVKNVREWIYPRSQELYQVLAKAAALQTTNPDHNFLPVLVCRRAHITTRFMAKDLGFFVIEARRHYLPESSLIDPVALTELTSELGLTDVVQGTDSTAAIEKRLRTLQRYFDLETALTRWKHFSSSRDFRKLINVLFDEGTSNKLRDSTLNELRNLSKSLGATLGW